MIILIFWFCDKFIVGTLDEFFITDAYLPSGWTHVVLNYFGPNNGQGIRVYYDGVQTKSDETKQAHVNPYQPGDGRVVLGRELIDSNSSYASADIDDFLFFNEALSDQNIEHMSNWKIEVTNIQTAVWKFVEVEMVNDNLLSYSTNF